MVRTTGNDGREQRLIDDIARHGWHIVASEQNSAGPAYAYSVGLLHTFGHPEVLVLGLHGATTMARLIEGIGQQVRQGTKFQDWHESDSLLEGYRCLFRELPSDIFCDYLSEAIWFYRGDSFPALQCFWPDREHRYPWQPKCRPGVVRRQPILPDPSDWPFAVGKNRTAHVSASVLAGAEVIVRASHNHNGTWTFVGEAAADSVDTKTATLAELLNRQPILGSLAELSAGWQATRDAQSDHWHVLPLPTPVDKSEELDDGWDAEQEDADQEDAEQEDTEQEDTVEDAEQAVVAHEDTEQDADETWDDEPWDDEPADEERCDISPLPALRPELLLPAEELPLTLRQQARKRRRPGPRLWPQWSLRTWLILFTVFAVLFGVIAYLRSPRPILARLAELNAEAEVAFYNDFEWSAPGRITHEMFGPFERFVTVGRLEVANDAFTDRDLRDVCVGGDLRKVDVESRSLTDGGVHNLSSCKHLWGVWLDCPSVTDEGLRSLAWLTDLVVLNVHSDQVTGEFVRESVLYRDLAVLTLRGKQVDDRVCNALDRIRHLEDVRLSDSAVTDEGLMHLARHRGLRYVDVRNSKVTAAGAQRFREAAPHIQFDSDFEP